MFNSPESSKKEKQDPEKMDKNNDIR